MNYFAKSLILLTLPLTIGACATGNSVESTAAPVSQEFHGPIQWTPKLLWPVEGGRITDTFEKVRGDSRIHQGLDIARTPMAKIYSSEDGKVIYRGYEPGYGNYIVIRHQEGWTTRYAHLEKYNVEWGHKVQKGDIIGYMGETGRATGTHLHFEVRHHNTPKDPMDFMEPDGLLTLRDFFGVPVPLKPKMSSSEKMRTAYINGPRVYLYY